MVVLSAASISLPAFAAPVLQIGNGILYGASGVLVNGTSYDVQFHDGTCAELFSGCSAQSDFQFNKFSDSSEASAALLTQVVHANDSLIANAVTPLANGCTESPCSIFTPYMDPSAGGLNSTTAYYLQGDSSKDSVLCTGFGYLFCPGVPTDTSIYAKTTYAVWTLTQIESVPEPSTYAMLWAGLGLTIFVAKRKTHAHACVC
jgi:hypothetical protein